MAPLNSRPAPSSPAATPLQDAAAPSRPRWSAAELEALTIEELNGLLHSPEHYAATTRNYGDRDPLVEPASLVWRCDEHCSAALFFDEPSPGQLKMARGQALQAGAAANFVRCDCCRKEGPPSLREWRAVVDWNYLRAREGLGSLEHFPFFLLDGLSPGEQLQKLEAIRYDLAVRRTLERKRRDAGEEVGKRFMAKMDAYLGWANIALTLLRSSTSPRVRQNQSGSQQKADRVGRSA